MAEDPNRRAADSDAAMAKELKSIDTNGDMLITREEIAANMLKRYQDAHKFEADPLRDLRADAAILLDTSPGHIDPSRNQGDPKLQQQVADLQKEIDQKAALSDLYKKMQAADAIISPNHFAERIENGIPADIETERAQNEAAAKAAREPGYRSPARKDHEDARMHKSMGEAIDNIAKAGTVDPDALKALQALQALGVNPSAKAAELAGAEPAPTKREQKDALHDTHQAGRELARYKIASDAKTPDIDNELMASVAKQVVTKTPGGRF